MQTSDPDALLRDAIAASQRNDSETALSLLARIGELAPHSAIPHLLAGGELAQIGRYAEAESAYAKAVLADPQLHIARYQLGLLQFTSGNMPMSMLSWQPLLELGPQHALSLFVQGFAQLAQDNFADAASLFQAGMATNTDNAPLNADIEMVLQRIAKLTGNDGHSAPQHADAAREPATEEPLAGAHVLLSNYGSVN